MKAEKFKELFDCKEPDVIYGGKDGIQVKSEYLSYDLNGSHRIISEELYQRMIAEIEMKPVIVSMRSPKAIIALANENAELKRGIGDLFLIINQGKKGIRNLSLKNDYSIVSAFYCEINGLLKLAGKIID